MVEECRETRIHGLVYDQHAGRSRLFGLGNAPLGMEGNALCSRRLGLELQQVRLEAKVQVQWSERTFVSMVGYVLEDMLMEVIIEPKPQLHTSRFGLCAIARGKLVGCAAAGDEGAAVER